MYSPRNRKGNNMICLLLLGLEFGLGRFVFGSLSGFWIFSSFLRSLGADTIKTGCGAGSTQNGVGREFLVFFSDDTGFLFLDNGLDGHDSRRDLLGQLHFFGSSVSLLWFLGVAGEEDDLASVHLQPLRVQLERLDRLVASAVINRNANSGGKAFGDLGSLQFFEGESLSGTDTCVVPECGATYDRSQGLSRPGEDTASLSDTVSVSPLLAGGLNQQI